MDTHFYQQLISRAAFGYAYHKAIFDEQGQVIDYEFVNVNTAFEELTGLNAAALIGRRVTEVMPSTMEQALDWLGRYWEVAKLGTSQTFEEYIVPLNKWYNVQVTLQADYHFSTIFTDITKSKKTELAIQAANDRIQRQRVGIVDLMLNEAVVSGDMSAAAPFITQLLAKVLAVARASIWLFSEDGTALHCIALYEALIQKYSSGAILYKKEYPFYFQTLAQETRIYVDDAQNDPRTIEFTEIYHKPFNITGLLDAGIIVNGKVVGVVCLEHVGTPRHWFADEESFSSTAATVAAQVLLNFERARAAQELRQSEQRFRDIVLTMGEAVFEVNEKLKISYISYKLDEMLDYPNGWILEKGMASVIHPEDLPIVTAATYKAVKEKTPIIDVEYRMLTRAGQVLWFVSNSAIMISKAGEFMGFRGTLSNITSRRRAQEEMLMRQAAEAANKAKSQFLANMSHEIRTPLNAVIGFTDLLCSTPLNAVQQQYVQNANTSAHALLGIINDILDFSKIEAGKLELDISQADIIDLVEQTADIVKYSSAQKGLELLLNLPPDMPRFASVDAVRLKQILVNLLSNAVKFTEKGEVQLTIDFHAIDHSKATYTFAVRDTGIGIEAAEQQKLFKAFAQADASTTRRFGGTGLGLTISNMLAEKMGSSIIIDSQIEKGSTFSFSLVAAYEAGQKKNTNSIENISSVLVVDDNENNRLILQHIFEHWGIAYKGCVSGLAALALLKNEHFDVLIVDYNMPIIDGIETIRRIRQQQKENDKAQPLILLHSSSDDERIYKASQELNICCKLVKPVKVEELYNALSSLAQRAQCQPNVIQKPNVIEQLYQLTPSILIAEDVAMNRLLVKKIIQQIIPNARLIEAQDGEEALQKALHENIDLVLMDVQMPKKDGYTCTKELRMIERMQPKRRRLPIVALTAGVVKDDKDKCLQSGMDDFLTKPIDKQELINVLIAYLVPVLDV
jgi:PAS domain S-box-containing protein